tara:strand:- start:182 stop:490 length:309 start_codon:yes stop_codon:yes gene_type:complete
LRATISATITAEAYAIYAEWAKDRTASDNISRSIADSYGLLNQIKALTIQRDLYRVRCSKIQRLSEDIDAGMMSSADEVDLVIREIWNTHPILVEQKTMEEY